MFEASLRGFAAYLATGQDVRCIWRPRSRWKVRPEGGCRLRFATIDTCPIDFQNPNVNPGTTESPIANVNYPVTRRRAASDGCPGHRPMGSTSLAKT